MKNLRIFCALENGLKIIPSGTIVKMWLNGILGNKFNNWIKTEIEIATKDKN